MTDYFNDELINQKRTNLYTQKKMKKQKFYSKNKIKIDALEKTLMDLFP